MNLQEHIRKVLRETVNESLFFRRRVDMRLMEKEFFETLNFATDMFFKRRYAGIDFTFKDKNNLSHKIKKFVPLI